MAEGGRVNGLAHPDRGGNSPGRVVSPLILNVALHGLETAAGEQYYPGRHGAGKSGAGHPGGGQIRR